MYRATVWVGAGACLAARPPADASSNAARKAAFATATSSVSSRKKLGICLACTSLLTGARAACSPAEAALNAARKSFLAEATSGASSKDVAAAATNKQNAQANIVTVGVATKESSDLTPMYSALPLL